MEHVQRPSTDGILLRHPSNASGIVVQAESEPWPFPSLELNKIESMLLGQAWLATNTTPSTSVSVVRDM